MSNQGAFRSEGKGAGRKFQFTRKGLKTLGIAALFLALASSTLYAFGSKSKSSQDQTASSQSSPSEPETVWVKRPDGGVSCEKEKAQSLEVGRSELEKAKVKVLDAKKDHDGKLRAQMCGLSSGTENTYKILKADLSKAITQGFKPAESTQ